MRFDTDDGHDYSCHVTLYWLRRRHLLAALSLGCVFRPTALLLLQVDVSDLLDLLSDYGRVC